MNENKASERSSGNTTNEWQVGPRVWISLVVVLLVLSGLLFKVGGVAWLGTSGFTTLDDASGTMKIPETSTSIGSNGISAKAGLLFVLSLAPTVALALGLLEIFTRYGVVRAARKLLTLLLRPLLEVPGYTGLALITDLQSTDVGAALTKELYDSKRTSWRGMVIMGAWQYPGAGLINSYFSISSALFASLTILTIIPLLLMLVLKSVGVAVTRLVLNTAYKGDFDNEQFGKSDQ